MTRGIKKWLQISSFAIFGSFMLINCEPDADNLGSQFFESGAAQDNVLINSLIAYNISNNDTIVSVASKLDSANLGAFNVPGFGLQKASYFSQVRLAEYGKEFGTNAVVDSVVLVIKPRFASDSVTTTTNASFTYPDGNVPSTKVVNTYPIVFKYGRTKINGNTPLTINVNEVTDFMGAQTTKLYSNDNFTEGTLLGSKIFNGKVSSVDIKKNSDNTELLKVDATIRLPLSTAFFQNKIISKSGMPEIADVASFIRYFRGIKISVAENDGYLFKFDPDQLEMIMYYKQDLVTDGVTTRPQSKFNFNLSGNTSVGGNNVQFQKVVYDRTNTAVSSALANANPIVGDLKLYPQGMGGPSIGLKIQPTDIANLKDLYKNQQAGILSAKIRLYADNSTVNSYSNLNNFIVKQNGLKTFLEEFSTYGSNVNYNFVTVKDLYNNASSAYYDIDVTKTVKNIVEQEASNLDFIVGVGQYTISTFGGFEGQEVGKTTFAQTFNTRSYTPSAAVLVGTDPSNVNRAQLRVIYAKK